MEHGTVSNYIHGKCRCDDCRTAKTDYMRRNYPVTVITYEGGAPVSHRGRMTERPLETRARQLRITDEGRAYLRALKQESAA